MTSRLFRATTATLLMLSLWSSVLVSAQTTQQDTAKQDNQTKPATSQKPLSPDEDPALIGKRKINNPGLNKIMQRSVESEVQLGRQLATEIDKEAKFVDDPIIAEYVNRVGQNIVLHSDAKVPFTIKVIDSDEINAFALPGGFFYVNKGLVLAADNESELAGVMAHEIAHVAARHAVETEAKGRWVDIGMIAAQILLPGTIAGAAIYNGAQFGTLLGFMKFNRAAEEEADKLGLQYMYAAGYDPNGMATMFEKLSAQNKKKPGTLSKLFASHPQSEDRRQASLSLASRFPEREEYVISTSEFQKVKGRMLKLSNARATTGGVIADDSNTGRPTLKRRTPQTDSSGAPANSGDTQTPSEETLERPTLRRNGDKKPEPTPTPTPTQ